MPILVEWIQYSPGDKIPAKERKLVKMFFSRLSCRARMLFSRGGIDPKTLYNDFLQRQTSRERVLIKEQCAKGRWRVIAVLTYWTNGKTACLATLAVLDSKQKKSLGSCLTDFLNVSLSQDGIEFVEVETKKRNKRMRNLLERLGFTVIEKNEECLALRKKLDQLPKKVFSI